jgi:hypothetical protein
MAAGPPAGGETSSTTQAPRHPPPISPLARLSIKDAFDRFKRTVSTDDARDFERTELQDVRAAAREIERELAARQSLRHMRRLQPFFDGIERYSKVVEILCNNTPYLP